MLGCKHCLSVRQWFGKGSHFRLPFVGLKQHCTVGNVEIGFSHSTATIISISTSSFLLLYLYIYDFGMILRAVYETISSTNAAVARATLTSFSTLMDTRANKPPEPLPLLSHFPSRVDWTLLLVRGILPPKLGPESSPLPPWLHADCQLRLKVYSSPLLHFLNISSVLVF